MSRKIDDRRDFGENLIVFLFRFCLFNNVPVRRPKEWKANCLKWQLTPVKVPCNINFGFKRKWAFVNYPYLSLQETEVSELGLKWKLIEFEQKKSAAKLKRIIVYTYPSYENHTFLLFIFSIYYTISILNIKFDFWHIMDNLWLRCQDIGYFVM